MNGQDLKNSILQLAVQGKLVEQREKEGNAKELIKLIKDEKKRLIKEKKIRKENPLTELKEEEAPFDIPDSWEWVKLGEVVSVYGGKRIPAGKSLTDEDTGYKYIRVADMKNGSVMLDNIKHIPVDIYEEIKNYTISKDEVYITVAGTIGQVGLIPEELDNANLTENADKLVVYSNDKEYIYHTLSSYFIQYQIKEYTTQVGQPKLAIKRIKELIIPIPPLEEQKRIVAKIEELMPYVDKYDIAYFEVQELNKKFPEDMKKSILEYAIQGKLVEQREEGTAEELYQKIREELKNLVKEGRIKKQKALPEITEIDIPFDIPMNWKWVRLGNVIDLLSGQDFPREKYNDTNKGIPYITGASSLSDKGVIVSRWTEEPRCIANAGDILLVCKGSGYGKIVICDVEEAHIARQIMSIKHSELINTMYLKYFMNASHALIKTWGQGVIPGIDRKSVQNMLFPLPPLEEQKRIVAKIKEVLPYSKQLVK